MPFIPAPEVWPLPILAGDGAAALSCPARAGKFIVRRAVAHGVVIGDLFAGCDIAHSNECNLARKPSVRCATVVDVVRRLAIRQRDKVVVVLNLQGIAPHATSRTRHTSCPPARCQRRRRGYAMAMSRAKTAMKKPSVPCVPGVSSRQSVRPSADRGGSVASAARQASA